MLKLIHKMMVLLGVLVIVIACNPSSVKGMEINNPFFFSETSGAKAYQGHFLFDIFEDSSLEKRVIVSSKEIGELSKGKVYEIEIKLDENIPSERLKLGYFYVQADRIDKCTANADNLKWIKEKKTFPKNSEIVCQNKPLKDKLREEEKGWHHYIEVKGDTRIYHAYNNQVKTGYYESFTWEKGEGLVAYRSGFGAERDSIELEIDRTINIVSTNNNLVYSNKQYGFYIQFPESWRGKYLIAEQDHMVVLDHINQKGIDDMCCYVIYILDSEKDWKDWGKDMIQLGRNKGHIYVARLGSGDYPFDTTTKEGMKKAKEIDKLFRDFDWEKCFGLID